MGIGLRKAGYVSATTPSGRLLSYDHTQTHTQIQADLELCGGPPVLSFWIPKKSTTVCFVLPNSARWSDLRSSFIAGRTIPDIQRGSFSENPHNSSLSHPVSLFSHPLSPSLTLSPSHLSPYSRGKSREADNSVAGLVPSDVSRSYRCPMAHDQIAANLRVLSGTSTRFYLYESNVEPTTWLDVWAAVLPPQTQPEPQELGGSMSGKWHVNVLENRAIRPDRPGRRIVRPVQSYHESKYWPAILSAPMAAIGGCSQALGQGRVNSLQETSTLFGSIHPTGMECGDGCRRLDSSDDVRGASVFCVAGRPTVYVGEPYADEGV